MLRTMAIRMARATGGGVDYWLKLPIYELLQFVMALAEQLEEEKEAAESAAKRR